MEQQGRGPEKPEPQRAAEASDALYHANFDIVAKAASNRFLTSLAAVTSMHSTGEVLVQFFFDLQPEERNQPDTIGWVAIQYDFINQPDTCLFQGKYLHPEPSDHRDIFDIPELAAIPAVTLAWDEIDWSKVDEWAATHSCE